MISTDVLILVRNGTWMSFSTNFNLYAQAKSLSCLIEEFTRICNLHSKHATNDGKLAFVDLKPADDWVVEMFNNEKSLSIDFDIPNNKSGVIIRSAKIYSLLV